jgi:hypothetical protein
MKAFLRIRGPPNPALHQKNPPPPVHATEPMSDPSGPSHGPSSGHRRQPRLTLLDLPAEIRTQVLEHHVVSLAAAHLRLCTAADFLPATYPLALLLTCRQLAAEARAVYFARVRVPLDLTHPPDVALLASPADPAAQLRRRVRAVAVRLARVGGAALQRVALPALRDMLLRGALRDVEVLLWPSAAPRGPWFHRQIYGAEGSGGAGGGGKTLRPEGGRLGSPPWLAVYMLFLDPYLERGALRAARAGHLPELCAFHAPVEGGERVVYGVARPQRPVEGRGEEEDGEEGGEGEEWLDLDVWGMIREYGEKGGEWEIAQVGERMYY